MPFQDIFFKKYYSETSDTELKDQISFYVVNWCDRILRYMYKKEIKINYKILRKIISSSIDLNTFEIINKFYSQQYIVERFKGKLKINLNVRLEELNYFEYTELDNAEKNTLINTLIQNIFIEQSATIGENIIAFMNEVYYYDSGNDSDSIEQEDDEMM